MARTRDQRGVVFPSPLVILSILAVAMAGVAWVATRHQAPTERLVPSAVQHTTGAHHSTYHRPRHHPAPSARPAKPTPAKPTPPKVDRATVVVQVFNNSHIPGLASQVAGRAGTAGWQVVGSDNWYGTIPASTVYYPARMKPAGRLLALDLGIHRSMPAVAPMRLDRLTVILTAELGAPTH